MATLYDREKESQALEQIEAQALHAATFTVVTGRRRIGKTALLRKFIDHKPQLGATALRSVAERLGTQSWPSDIRQDHQTSRPVRAGHGLCEAGTFHSGHR